MLNRVGISENQPNEKSKALYSELAIAMESSIVSNILAEIQSEAGRGIGNLCNGKKKPLGMTQLEVVGTKKLYMSYLEVRHLTWLSLIGPKLEPGTKIREAVS